MREDLHKLRLEKEALMFTYAGPSRKKRLISRAAHFFLGEKHKLQASQPELIEQTWQLPNLPQEAAGLRILHLSDTHLDGVPQLTENLIELLKDTDFDLVLWTGDFRFGKWALKEEELLPTIKLVKALPCRLGHWGCLGNHDILAQKEALELSCDLKILINEGQEILPGLWLAGIDDPHFYQTHDLQAAFCDAPKDSLRLLMAHSPEAAEEASRHNTDLYLCGHTHGGQIHLPLLGMVHWNANCPKAHAVGKWQIGKMQAFTHSGTGCSTAPLRRGPRAAVYLHTLR